MVLLFCWSIQLYFFLSTRLYAVKIITLIPFDNLQIYNYVTRRVLYIFDMYMYMGVDSITEATCGKLLKGATKHSSEFVQATVKELECSDRSES